MQDHPALPLLAHLITQVEAKAPLSTPSSPFGPAAGHSNSNQPSANQPAANQPSTNQPSASTTTDQLTSSAASLALYVEDIATAATLHARVGRSYATPAFFAARDLRILLARRLHDQPIDERAVAAASQALHHAAPTDDFITRLELQLLAFESALVDGSVDAELTSDLLATAANPALQQSVELAQALRLYEYAAIAAGQQPTTRLVLDLLADTYLQLGWESLATETLRRALAHALSSGHLGDIRSAVRRLARQDDDATSLPLQLLAYAKLGDAKKLRRTQAKVQRMAGGAS